MAIEVLSERIAGAVSDHTNESAQAIVGCRVQWPAYRATSIVNSTRRLRAFSEGLWASLIGRVSA